MKITDARSSFTWTRAATSSRTACATTSSNSSFTIPAKQRLAANSTDLGVQLLHKSADGKMAIVDVRLAMDRGNPNAVLAMLWPHLPKKPGTTEKVTDMVNPGGFLPADRGYWTYMGSLSTPPCTEGVRWFVLKNDISLSLEQLRAFTILFRMNSRPSARRAWPPYRSQRIAIRRAD